MLFLEFRNLAHSGRLRFLKNEPSQCEVGITLAPTHQHHGYATEVVQAVLEFLFVELDKHPVFVSVDPRNEAAIARLRRELTSSR